MKKKIWFFLLLPLCASAQNFTHKAKVAAVTQTGFYRIRINPDISGYAQDGMQDLRLFDNDGKEVPYYLYQEPYEQNEVQLKSFPFTLSKDGNRFVVTVDNKEKQTLNKFLFTMRNANATRTVRISGSDDKHEWYVVRDSFYFYSAGNDTSAQQEKSLDFPATNYRYFKIEFSSGHHELPLNIIHISSDRTAIIPATYQAIRHFRFTVSDSGRFSIIHCALKPKNKVDQLRLDIDAPETYQRAITVQTYGQVYRDQVSSYSYSREPQAHAIQRMLSSRNAAILNCRDLSGYSRCDSMRIVIDNKDDAPLHIRNISAFQLVSTITAKLEPSKRYFLYFGDSMMAAPEYDIVYFKENLLPTDKTLLETEPVVPKIQKDKEEYDGHQDKVIVWIGLALAGGTLLLLTLSMVKKMKQEQA